VLAALLVAVGVCAGLWRVLASGEDSSRSNEVESSRRDGESLAPSSIPTSSELQATKIGRAEPIAPSESSAVAVQPTALESKVRLFGSILDARDRSPVTGGVSVRITDEAWEERSLSGSSGRGYEFTDLHPGTWEIRVEATGFQTLRTRTVLDRDENEKRVDLLVLPALVVRVRVEGVVGWNPMLAPDYDGLRLGGVRSRATEEVLSAEERWLAMLLPESVELSVIPTVLAPGNRLDEEDDRTSRIGRFIARSALQSDRLTQERRRRQGLGYSTEEDRNSLRLPDGSLLSELPPTVCGVLLLSEAPPAFVSIVFRDFVIRTVAIPAGADEVTIALSREGLGNLFGRVRLRVVDADSNERPVGVGVRIDENALGKSETELKEDGTITFVNLPIGSSVLTIQAPGYENIVEHIRVLPGAPTDLGTYRLQRFASIEARVVDDVGLPAAVHFNVFPFDRYDATRATLAKRIFRSSHEGVLKIDSVGRGRYLIVSHDENWIAAPVLADTEFRQRDPLQIRVSKGTDVVLRMRADPPLNGRLAIRTKSGLPVADRACSSRDAMRFRLAPANYSVELYDGEAWLWSEGLAVGVEPIRSYLPR
jgi:hypothetical protein